MTEPTLFKVGEASPANTFLAIWMAEDAGFFKANGLQLELVIMAGGRECGPMLTQGKIDLMHIGMSSVIRAKASGADIVTIGSLSNVIRAALFTAPGIKTPDDLKGSTVGISSAGSESEPTTVMALERLGLSRADVTLKEIGASRLPALREGTVSATMLGEPHRSTAIAEGLEPMVDLLANKIPWLYSGLVVHRSFLSAHRDTALAGMRAIIEGNYLAISDPERAKTVLARECGIEDPAITDITYDNFRAATPAHAEASLEGAKNNIAAVATGEMSRNIDDYVDTSVHNALQAEGFFDSMAQKYGTP
ncbi:MAG: NitT/TauT family transport system substrate-binding protein [Alphaproteobacteria bacterium]|jgi:NitT/TauT family transport system substrate-binding protein